MLSLYLTYIIRAIYPQFPQNQLFILHIPRISATFMNPLFCSLLIYWLPLLWPWFIYAPWFTCTRRPNILYIGRNGAYREGFQSLLHFTECVHALIWYALELITTMHRVRKRILLDSRLFKVNVHSDSCKTSNALRC